MSEATIPLVDSKSLLTLFGTRDQHLRKIRDSLGVSVSSRNDRIHIEGQEEAVAHATEVFEQLKDLAARYGTLSPEEVSQVLATVTGQKLDVDNAGIELQFAGRPIRPRTAGQARYVSAIRDHDLVFCIGPAGTGKTYLAVACAVEALQSESVRRIVLVRPAVEAGERLGFLPGDLSQKVDPYLRPMYDALYEMLGFERVAKLIERNVIEVAPLAFMRGRSLNDSFVILDEAQNTTNEQMKMFLTRIGFGSKAVVTGDITQVDLPNARQSGLRTVIDILRGVHGIAFTMFTSKDVVRHPLVQRIVQAYEARTPDEGR